MHSASKYTVHFEVLGQVHKGGAEILAKNPVLQDTTNTIVVSQTVTQPN